MALIDHVERRIYGIVAFIISFDAIVQAPQRLLDERLDHTFLRVAAAGILFISGLWVENLNVRRGGFS